jgi:mono/diheme cytochrome c family protein
LAFADEPASSDKVSYHRDIRPVMQARCQGCHQPAKRGGDYVMTDYAALLKGGESGDPAVVPGKPGESYLVDLITPAAGEVSMPKGGKPLDEAEIELIRRWIAHGAADDTPKSAQPRFDMDHPPVYAAPPVITSLDYSPDGKLLAVSGYHEVVIHRADGSGIATRLVGLSERIEKEPTLGRRSGCRLGADQQPSFLIQSLTAAVLISAQQTARRIQHAS